MKYISVITDYEYLLWQQEIQIFNFKQLGMLKDLVVVVLYEPGQQISEHARALSRLATTYFYVNDQVNRSYIPSNKPWGLMKLLEQYPEYGQRVFLLDSDVIFRRPLDTEALDKGSEDKTWYVSDSGVISYIGYEYLKSCLGTEPIEEMAAIVGVSTKVLKERQEQSGGAQYYMKDIDAGFCRKVALDSTKIYDWSIKQLKEDGSYKFQVWTAEMWSWLWNGFMRADIQVSQEMSFSWATDPAQFYFSRTMLHMAGVTGSETGCFFKGKYARVAPWDLEADFNFVSTERCWRQYADLIEEYKKTL
jgi:hypothetical protein